MRHYCDNCRIDVTDIRVKCAECSNFDLCLQCFSFGAEIGKHSKNHAYQIINYGDNPVFPKEKSWAPGEEIELLEKVTRYGIGNWEKIAELIETKTPKEVEEHLNFYIHGNLGQALWPTVQVPTIKDYTDGKHDVENAPIARKNKSYLLREDCVSVGYLPLREEFEEEYDNGAEALVSHLSENEEDDDLDKALKCALIEIYNTRVHKRLECKRIVQEYDLVRKFIKDDDKPQHSKTSKSATNDLSETKDKYNAFCRFHSSPSHEQLLNDIQRQKKIKARMRELMRYRKNGITKFEDASKFGHARNNQLKSKENKKKVGSSSSSSQKHITSSVDIKKEKKTTDTNSKQEKGVHAKYKENIGQDLLTRSEKKLCSSIRLRFSHYITLKAQLLKERHRKSKGILHKFPLPSGLSKANMQTVVAFFVQSGWLKKD